jgi:hypothetical protein
VTKVCVVRNDSLPQEQLRTEGIVAIGWDEKIGAEAIGRDYPEVKALLRQAHPDVTGRRIGNWSGQVWLFCTAMEEGDVVVAPVRGTGTVDLGVVSGPAYWDSDALVYGYRRPVEWVELGTRRTMLSEASQRGLKAQLTCYTHRSGDELREIVEARRGVDIGQVRALLSELVDGTRGAGVDPSPYEMVRDDDDPVRAVRELVGRPFATSTFVELNGMGKRSLSLEGLVVDRAKDVGIPSHVVERARDRLEFYGA